MTKHSKEQPGLPFSHVVLRNRPTGAKKLDKLSPLQDGPFEVPGEPRVDRS